MSLDIGSFVFIVFKLKLQTNLCLYHVIIKSDRKIICFWAVKNARTFFWAEHAAEDNMRWTVFSNLTEKNIKFGEQNNIKTESLKYECELLTFSLEKNGIR